jgi:cytochrome c peroxidase
MSLQKTFICLLIPMIIGCKKPNPDDLPLIEDYHLNIPKGFPMPKIPEDNLLTKDRVALGKMLFHDKLLSKDKTISCASCHSQSHAFSDNKAFSIGVDGQLSERNSMPIMNLAWSPSFFWDGGVPTLELQVFAPLTNPKEMNISIAEVVQRLKDHPEYPGLFRKAYNREPDDFSLFRAIASYERTLISGNSKFDQYYYQGNTSAMNASELRGMDLFFGDSTHCSSCHNGFNFTNNTFQNNGIYEVYQDWGRYNVTNDFYDIGKFRVPSLRNIALTAPYMHDGSFETLEEVIEHYQNGGKKNSNQSSHVHQLYLTEQEKTDLVNFLKALTDETFINNHEHKP